MKSSAHFFCVIVLASIFAPSTDAQRTLIITMDDISKADYPVIDGLSAMTFPNFYVHPLCQPTRASLTTGRRPWRTTVGGNTIPALPFSEVTTMEAIPNAFHTWIGKWHLGREVLWSPIAQGIDLFSGTTDNIDPRQDYWKHGKRLQYPWKDIRTHSNDYSTREITNEAITMLGLLQGEWVTQVHYHAAHSPFSPPPGYLDRDDETDYANMVEYLGEEIERLLTHVDLDETFVLLMSDNGGPFGRGKGSVLQEGVNVTLFAAGTFRGKRIEAIERPDLVAVEDLFATVLEHHNVTSTAEDSISLGPTLLTGAPHARTEALCERWHPLDPPFAIQVRAALTTQFGDTYKLIHDCVADSTKLYNITQDPGEDTPLYPGGVVYDFLVDYLAKNGGCD